MDGSFSLMLVLAACRAGAGNDATSSSSSSSSTSTLDLSGPLQKAVAKNKGYGGGILQVRGEGGLRYSGVSGERTYQGDPVQEDDTFEVASVTKTFTATMVMLLVEDGKLRVDETLGEALPEWSSGLLVVHGKDLTATITLKQLMNHTSGLPDYWTDPPFVSPQTNAFLEAFEADPDHFWTPEEILSYVGDLNPIGTPGQTWHYSDTNYVLLGLIVEKVTGQALHDAMRARIWDPLGMDHTWMSFREGRPFPDCHRYEDDWDMTIHTHQTADWAGGGLVSNAKDLSVFLRSLSQGDLFQDPDTLATMQTWVPTGETDLGYGLGLFEVDLDDGSMLWGHDGYGNAFMYLHDSDGALYTGTLDQQSNDWWPMVAPAL